jgi:hypothetical protein
METFGNKFVAKKRKQFYCSTCDYITFNKFDYEKHCNTMKHKSTILSTKTNDLETKIAKISQVVTPYTCECGKSYKERSGLWKHRKKCVVITEDLNSNCSNNKHPSLDDKDLIMALIKDNSELKNLIFKVIEKESSSINNNTNTNNSHNTSNSHNKTFNLSFYLNETCKDAINIGDFVKSIKVQLEDLENTGRLGYVNGVSDIIINNLNSIDTHKRPIHCTDEKREVLYIKNDGEWVKEVENKPILTNAIKTIANENIKAISEWKKTYPDCVDADSKKNNLYLKIVSNSMSGCSKEECEKNYNKIIKNIAKETVIDKDNC